MADESTSKHSSGPKSGKSPAHIAESAPMEMSAPIEEIPSESPSTDVASQLSRPLPPMLQGHAAPLSDEVAPFKTAEPVNPAVEYVQLQPTTLRPEPAARPSRPARPPIQHPSAPPRHGRTLVPLPHPLYSGEPEAAAQPAAPVAGPPLIQQAPRKRARKIYSHNTRAVWKFRKSTRRIYAFVAVVLIVALTGLFAYWQSIGAPDKVENIPLIRRIINQ
jgi:hypothetical protein